MTRPDAVLARWESALNKLYIMIEEMDLNFGNQKSLKFQ